MSVDVLVCCAERQKMPADSGDKKTVAPEIDGDHISVANLPLTLLLHSGRCDSAKWLGWLLAYRITNFEFLFMNIVLIRRRLHP